MKHYGDITKINGTLVEACDIVVGGSPCQDLSVAGLRAGFKNKIAGDGETTRSGLFYDMVRVIKEMRENAETGADGSVRRRPRFVLWENVPGVLSASASDGGKGTAFQAVLTEFLRIKDREAPIVPMPGNGWPNEGEILCPDARCSVAWRITNAAEWGVPQRRRRIAVLCDLDGMDAGKIVFEKHPAGLCRPEIQPIGPGVYGY